MRSLAALTLRLAATALGCLVVPARAVPPASPWPPGPPAAKKSVQLTMNWTRQGSRAAGVVARERPGDHRAPRPQSPHDVWVERFLVAALPLRSPLERETLDPVTDLDRAILAEAHAQGII